MAIGAYMSIAFMGNALREFQEIGYIPATHVIGIIPRLDINLASMTGIHPTLETIVGQLILLSIYIVGSLYVLVIQPTRKKKIDALRKSMADIERKKESYSLPKSRISTVRVQDYINNIEKQIDFIT
jgi:high-affinity iron transporter